jgi:hypothetical protein
MHPEERRSEVTEMLDGRIPDNFDPDALNTYMDDIDNMGLDELEEQLPQAQEALEAIESKLEELMGLKDAALVCAAAMSARLAALKQTEAERGKGI